jgi:hypothetical protein
MTNLYQRQQIKIKEETNYIVKFLGNEPRSSIEEAHNIQILGTHKQIELIW